MPKIPGDKVEGLAGRGGGGYGAYANKESITVKIVGSANTNKNHRKLNVDIYLQYLSNFDPKPAIYNNEQYKLGIWKPLRVIVTHMKDPHSFPSRTTVHIL